MFALFLLAAFGSFDVQNVKTELTDYFAQKLEGRGHQPPILMLIGGFPGSGKTTLIDAVTKNYDFTVISLDAIRQAQVDRGIRGTPFDWEIVETVYQNLLRVCAERKYNVVIDTNSHSARIKEITQFLNQEKLDYQTYKICLNPPFETLLERVRARVQLPGLHQGTEQDLKQSFASKKIDLEDYDLVLETVSFEEEWERVNKELALRISQTPLEPLLR